MTDKAPRTEARWEEWARQLAPLIHDGLIDTPQERSIPDKAFYLARLLDEHLAAASPPSVDALDAVARIKVRLERQIDDPINRAEYPEAVAIYQNAVGLVLEVATELGIDLARLAESSDPEGAE